MGTHYLLNITMLALPLQNSFGICWWVDVYRKWDNNILPDTEEWFWCLYILCWLYVLFQNVQCPLRNIANKREHDLVILSQSSGNLKVTWRDEFSFLPACQSICVRCPSLSARLRCHTQSAPSHREACGADSWDGTACHICYSCHQLQETSHKWSGLWVSEDVRLVTQQHSGLPMPTPPLTLTTTTANPHVPSPSVSTLSPSLLIVTVWHWKTFGAAQNKALWFAHSQQCWKRSKPI